MDNQNEDLNTQENLDNSEISEIRHSYSNKKQRVKREINWVLIVLIILLLLFFGFVFKDNFRYFFNSMFHSIDKPIIYLYTEEEMKVSVKLDFDKKSLTCTYPKYDNGWVVNAEPDGTLFTADGKEYSYLFWEAESTIKYDLSNGFIVKSTEAETFLQEKLSYMGMTPKEYNEFIVYWLPKLEANEFNLIKFAQKEYTDQFPLKIQPQPDSMLRIFMVMKATKGDEKVQAQTLKPFERKGFAVVEWGGTELDS